MEIEPSRIHQKTFRITSIGTFLKSNPSEKSFASQRPLYSSGRTEPRGKQIPSAV
jgi:hypothetical protein